MAKTSQLNNRPGKAKLEIILTRATAKDIKMK